MQTNALKYSTELLATESYEKKSLKSFLKSVSRINSEIYSSDYL